MSNDDNTPKDIGKLAEQIIDILKGCTYSEADRTLKLVEHMISFKAIVS